MKMKGKMSRLVLSSLLLLGMTGFSGAEGQSIMPARPWR